MHRRPYTLLENTSIALAILMYGIMAGFFWTYTFNVNLATAQLDGATYARVQSLFNVNVRHFIFFAFFFGSAVMAIVALLINYKHYREPSFWLLVLATVIYIAGIIFFTREINLPLNYYTESWDPNHLPRDWAQTRSNWNSANAWRVLTAGLAFAISTLVLVLRSTSPKIHSEAGYQ